jgi:hypothetical protein
MSQQGNETVRHVETDTSPYKAVKSHAYIIWGGDQTERTRASETLAAAAVCESGANQPCQMCRHCQKAARGVHPDIAVIDRPPDKKEIVVDQIRALREDAVILPNEAEKKVYILRNADSMNPAAQNALLKLLEEPPPRVTIILEAETPSALLATVRSRSVMLSAGQALPDLSGVKEVADEFIQALSEGPLALTAFSFRLEKLDKSKFPLFVDGVRTLLAEKLRENARAGAAVFPPDFPDKAFAALSRADDYYNANVGLGHIAGMLCAELAEAATTLLPRKNR